METDSRLERIMREYGSLLRRTIARVCPRELGIQCDDIEQEAYVRLWRAVEAERNIQDLASYIYRVAVTTTLDAVRRVKARREQQLAAQDAGDSAGDPPPGSGTPAGAASSPGDIVHRATIRREVLEAVERLPANRRRAVGLYLQGMSNREVGAILGWSEAKARNLIYRGLNQLRARLRAAGITSSHDARLGD